MKTVCGLDVHKDSVFCCILCANGEKIQHKFGVLTGELVTLRNLMVSEGVEECAMESTSIYWIPIWRVLEGSVKLHLANPYFIKQLPGKKSDVKDAEWIATCLSKEEIELQQRHKDEAQEKMTALCKEWFPEELENLQTIPGVKERSATSIIAETGTDMTHFQTPKKLVSWVGLRPRNEESAGKIKARGITHGNRFIRKTMIECSWGAVRMKDSFFAEFSYRQCIERRKNRMKVQVAIARKMLVAIWYVLRIYRAMIWDEFLRHFRPKHTRKRIHQAKKKLFGEIQNSF